MSFIIEAKISKKMDIDTDLENKESVDHYSSTVFLRRLKLEKNEEICQRCSCSLKLSYSTCKILL